MRWTRGPQVAPVEEVVEGWGAGGGLQERVEESGKLGGEETAARMGFLFPF